MGRQAGSAALRTAPECPYNMSWRATEASYVSRCKKSGAAVMTVGDTFWHGTCSGWGRCMTVDADAAGSGAQPG